MREFFSADEAAAELQRLTQTSWSAAQVMREAEQGSLPICFQYQGKIGVFKRQDAELVRAIFGTALRTGYLPRGSYLRVQGHPSLADVRHKQDELQARNLEMVNQVSGASGLGIAPSETLRIVADSGGFKGTAAVPFRVPSAGWLFHADDLNKLASAAKNAPTPQRTTALPAEASDAAGVTVFQDRPKARGWWAVSSAYIVEEMKAGQYATCKDLYRALEAKVGPNAPFDKGTGANRGSLFVREISQPLSLKTVQNNWQALRELAQK